MNKEIENGVAAVKKFANESYRFLEVCEKPDMAGNKWCKIEFKKIAQSCALGFAIMGGIGYVVKLLFIPINNIILSWLFHNVLFFSIFFWVGLIK